MTYEMSKENKAYLGEAAKKLEEHFNNREKEINEITKRSTEEYESLIKFNNKDWKRVNELCTEAINSKLDSTQFLAVIQKEVQHLLKQYVNNVLENYQSKDSKSIKSIADKIGEIPINLIDDTRKAFTNKSKM